jgi:hypothetical protein
MAVADMEPPPDVILQARASFGWRDVSAQVARLEFDSAVDDDDLARVRTISAARRLSFRSEAFSLVLEVHEGPRRIVGRIEPSTPMIVELRQPTTESSVSPDEFGYFSFDGVSRGAVSLRCTLSAGGAAVDTEWVTL